MIEFKNGTLFNTQYTDPIIQMGIDRVIGHSNSHSNIFVHRNHSTDGYYINVFDLEWNRIAMFREK